MDVAALAAFSTSAVSARTSQDLAMVMLKQKAEAVQGIVDMIKDAAPPPARSSAKAVDIVA